jgi:hypothetical protein
VVYRLPVDGFFADQLDLVPLFLVVHEHAVELGILTGVRSLRALQLPWRHRSDRHPQRRAIEAVHAALPRDGRIAPHEVGPLGHGGHRPFHALSTHVAGDDGA